LNKNILVINNNIIKYRKFKLIRLIFAFICILFPTIIFAQKDIIFVEAFNNNDNIIENEIIISEDFVQFKNSEIDITISSKNDIVELQLHLLGVKWSGTLSAFQSEYNNFITITTDKKYSADKIGIRKRDSLIQINDAILENDSVLSFNDNYYNFDLLKIDKGENILEFSTTKYKNSNSNIVESEIWFGYKLKRADINALMKLNTVLQKITLAYGKQYSINLNYLSKNNIPFFPLKVIEKNIKSNTANKEEIVAFQQKEIDKNKCHSNDNYQSISLFDLLLGAKTEISK